MKNNRYWMCIIGPVDDKDIPSTGDIMLRMSARNKFNELFGKDKVCTSGWSIDEKRYHLLQFISLLSNEDIEKLIKQHIESKI